MNKTAVVPLENNLSNLLSSYLLGQKSLLECAEWFSTIDWGSIDVESELARKLGKLQVICTEVSEGLRQEAEFLKVASEVLAKISKESCIRFWISRPEVVSSSSSENIENIFFMPMADPESPSWNISPQVVSA